MNVKTAASRERQYTICSTLQLVEEEPHSSSCTSAR